MIRDTMRVRKLIRNRISSAAGTAGIYYGQAVDAPAFPYIIFSVEDSQVMDGRIRAEVEINVVDHNTDTTVCEELTDRVQEALDHWYGQETYTKDGKSHTIGIVTYIDRRKNVAEEDRAIVRRRLTIETYIYEE